jgi:hypothetical protein
VPAEPNGAIEKSPTVARPQPFDGLFEQHRFVLLLLIFSSVRRHGFIFDPAN